MILQVEINNNKSKVINSIPDVVISKIVDNILNNTKYTAKDFTISTN